MPPERRSKRALCQWHVTRPLSTVPRWSGKPMWGQRSSRAKGAPSLQKTQTGWLPALPVRHPPRWRSASVPIVTRSSIALHSSPCRPQGCTSRCAGPGPAVVFTHGFGRTGDTWAPQVEALAGDHHVVTWDMRGHGRSEAPPGLYTREDALADLGAVVDAAMAEGGGPGAAGRALARRVLLAGLHAGPSGDGAGTGAALDRAGLPQPRQHGEVQPGRRRHGDGGGPGRQRRPTSPSTTTRWSSTGSPRSPARRW